MDGFFVVYSRGFVLVCFVCFVLGVFFVCFCFKLKKRTVSTLRGKGKIRTNYSFMHSR